MRDPERISVVLDAIEKYWRKHPDLRLGQILVNATGKNDLFFPEEDAVLQGLRRLEEPK